MTATELDRDVGLGGAVALGTGTMIAAGIFVLSGVAVGAVGAMAVAAFLLAAATAGLTALSYAEFAGRYPESGGGYAYVANVFDTDLTYVVGWAMALGYPATAAFYVASFSEWTDRFLLPAMSLTDAVPYWALGIAMLGVLLGVNLLGTRESTVVQLLVVLLKLGAVGAFLYGALSGVDPGIVADAVRANAGALSEFRGLLFTSGLVFVTFFGFEAIATSAEEIDHPARTVPRAIFLSLGIVVAVYTLVVVGLVVAVERPAFLAFLATEAGLAGPEAASAFLADSGEVTMGYAAQFVLDSAGEWAYLAVVVGALLSMVSAANATVMAGSRVKLAMSRRGHLPDWVGRLHPRANTPYAAVLLTGSFILAFVATFTVLSGADAGPLGLTTLVQFANVMLLVGLSAVNVALVASRWKSPDADRSFRVPLVPLVPALAVLLNLLLLLGLELDATLLGVGTLTAATVVGWPLLDPNSPSTPVSDHDRAASDDVTVLTPVRDESDRSLVTVGGALAAGTGGRVMPLSVVELPAQTPPSAGEQRADRQDELLEQVTGGVRDEYVEGRVRAAHEFGHAVRNAVDEHDPEVLLLSPADAVDVCLFGGGRTLLSSLEETFDCDVGIYRPGSLREIDSVFVGAADDAHAESAVAAAAAVARAADARVDIYRAVPSDVGDDALRSAHDDIERRANALADVETRTLVEPTAEPDEAFLDRSASADLVVIGSTGGREADVSVAGAVLREREDPTLVIQSGEGSVHLPLF